MIKKRNSRALLISIFSITSLILIGLFDGEKHLCKGIVEDHNMIIPLSTWQQTGISEQDFHSALDAVNEVFAPIVAQAGGNLIVQRRWSDDRVNATASRSGRNYVITMYGGLARHPAVTKDGFQLVACHEIGHHIGGAPKVNRFFNSWASNEGQSDYYANLECTRLLWPDDENREWLSQNEVNPTVVATCNEVYGITEDQIHCYRASHAGLSLAQMLQSVRNEPEGPEFETPDERVADRTLDSHPATQCRLDTYFQSALCQPPKGEQISETDPFIGTCSQKRNFTIGTRPRCWFPAG